MHLSTVFAQVYNPFFSRNPRGQSGSEFFSNILSLAITAIIIIGGLYFFFMLTLGAIKWLSSGGDKGQVQSARDQITHALVGLVILFSAWAIAGLVETIFGINLIQIDLSSVIA